MHTTTSFNINQRKKRRTLGPTVFVLFALVASVFFTTAQPADASSDGLRVSERMTDRCSQAVFIPSSYNGKPGEAGVTIVRAESGWSDWTEPFSVETSSSGRIRWWCNSTIGNPWDPGTWRIKVNVGKMLICGAQVAAGGVVSVVSGGTLGAAAIAAAEGFAKSCFKGVLGSSAVDGWTPERSRCDSRTSSFRARLGSNRLLQIECLEGIEAPSIGSISQAITNEAPVTPAASACQVVAGHAPLAVTAAKFRLDGTVDFTVTSNDHTPDCGRYSIAAELFDPAQGYVPTGKATGTGYVTNPNGTFHGDALANLVQHGAVQFPPIHVHTGTQPTKLRLTVINTINPSTTHTIEVPLP